MTKEEFIEKRKLLYDEISSLEQKYIKSTKFHLKQVLTLGNKRGVISEFKVKEHGGNITIRVRYDEGDYEIFDENILLALTENGN